ncbi:hypothetical protein [Streptomyces tateyamensis]|uniref:hypothetical protein n=1 Tax=Streptomyces tateyamensis TaxID=565073 RepID=UPI0015E8E7A9|nr:hypothetical protein [Streptomyces tateyamensis]
MGEMFAKALTTDGTGLGSARRLLGTANGPGEQQPKAPAVAEQAIPVQGEGQ